MYKVGVDLHHLTLSFKDGLWASKKLECSIEPYPLHQPGIPWIEAEILQFTSTLILDYLPWVFKVGWNCCSYPNMYVYNIVLHVDIKHRICVSILSIYNIICIFEYTVSSITTDVTSNFDHTISGSNPLLTFFSAPASHVLQKAHRTKCLAKHGTFEIKLNTFNCQSSCAIRITFSICHVANSFHHSKIRTKKKQRIHPFPSLPSWSNWCSRAINGLATLPRSQDNAAAAKGVTSMRIPEVCLGKFTVLMQLQGVGLPPEIHHAA